MVVRLSAGMNEAGMLGAWFCVFGGALGDVSHLPDQIVKLGEDCGRLQADKARLEEEFSMLQQKVEVLKELSHQKELELQK